MILFKQKQQQQEQQQQNRQFLISFILLFAFKNKCSYGLMPTTTTTTTTSLGEMMERRELLQIILFGPFAVTANIQSQDKAAAAAPVVTFAKDKYGTDLKAETYIASKPPRDRSLVMGLKGDPTYLLIKNSNNSDEKKELENFALNAECSHLGCIVPWNEFENKFVCPCHGSQYDSMGQVLRGPAPYPLALAHVTVPAEDGSGRIAMTPWTENDFRTNEKPWWN